MIETTRDHYRRGPSGLSLDMSRGNLEERRLGRGFIAILIFALLAAVLSFGFAGKAFADPVEPLDLADRLQTEVVDGVTYTYEVCNVVSPENPVPQESVVLWGIYSETESDVEVPASFGGHPLVDVDWQNIGDTGTILTLDFRNCTDLREFTMGVISAYPHTPNSIVSLDFRSLTKLESIDIGDENVKDLNITGCSGLKDLFCMRIPLKQLDLSGCDRIESLTLSVVDLTNVDISDKPYLTDFDYSGSYFTYPSVSISNCGNLKNLSLEAVTLQNFSGCESLEVLDFEGAKAGDLDLSGLPHLEAIGFRYSGATKIDASGCENLEVFYGEDGAIKALDCSDCPKLKTVRCRLNEIRTLNLDDCDNLTTLWCDDNPLGSIDLGPLPRLNDLSCGGCNLSSLDLSPCPMLQSLRCDNNKLTTLNLQPCTVLRDVYCDYNDLKELDISKNMALTGGSCTYNNIRDTDALIACFGERNVLPQKDMLQSAVVTGLEKSYACTGEVIEPDFTLTYDGVVLRKDTDYTVSYSNNLAIGEATITIKGTGLYSGTRTLHFDIVGKDPKFTASVSSLSIKVGEKARISFTFDSDGYVQLSSGDTAIVGYDYVDDKTFDIVGIEKGSAILTAKLGNTSVYNGATLTIPVTILGADDPGTGDNPGTTGRPADAIPIYRAYNKYSGEHIFTKLKQEYDTLCNGSWKGEGIAWYAPAHSDKVVYRLYNPNSGDHHYTTDYNEYMIRGSQGWNKEGEYFYSAGEDTTPIYRLFNSHVQVGTHHYTTDHHEYDTLGSMGYTKENIGWYGYKAD